MFENQFYPTPKEVIRKMLQPFRGHDFIKLSILEPSAGNGNILDYIKNNMVKDSRWYQEHFSAYCVEKDKELQFILQEKGYKLIGEDFLKYSGDYYFDLIIMNPPFSNGDEHLLHAWEILDEGDIVCLLNEETIKNPFSNKRVLLNDLIGQHGSVEYLGNCFRGSDVPTDVNVVLVRLHKENKNSRLKFNFQNVASEKHDINSLNENTINNPVAVRDIIGNMIVQYDKLKAMYIEYLKIKEGMDFYKHGLFGSSFNFEKALDNEGKDNKQKYNFFCDMSKLEIWRQVLNRMGMERYMTNNVRKNFSKFIEQQGAMDFTKENVANLINTLLLNKTSIMELAIGEVFDIFTKYHKENRCHVEGWKTNDKWKVNKKIILPYFVSTGWGNGDYYTTESNHWNAYSDIDKVMAYISGIKYEEFDELIEQCDYNTRDRDKKYKRISLKQGIQQTPVGDSSKNETEFFYIRCYKKGTLHLEFKDAWLWKEFNYWACSGKNWLRESEKKEWETKKNSRGLI